MVLILALIAANQNAFCQPVVKDVDSCSIQIEAISYFWKLDSLGTNGCRLYAYEKLLKCKRGNITSQYLERNLGKPNEIKKVAKDSLYIYYYFNGHKIPREAHLAKEIFFIYYRFGKGSPYVTDIGIDFLE